MLQKCKYLSKSMFLLFIIQCLNLNSVLTASSIFTAEAEFLQGIIIIWRKQYQAWDRKCLLHQDNATCLARITSVIGPDDSVLEIEFPQTSPQWFMSNIGIRLHLHLDLVCRYLAFIKLSIPPINTTALAAHWSAICIKLGNVTSGDSFLHDGIAWPAVTEHGQITEKLLNCFV